MWNGTAWVPEPRPGVIPLRPLSLGEILGGAFKTVRRNLAATLGAAAAVMCLVEATRIVATYFLLRGVSSPTVTTAPDGTADFHGSAMARVATLQVVVGGVTLVAISLLTGVLTATIGRAVLGQAAPAQYLWREARPLVGRLIGTVMLIAGSIFAVITLGAVPGLVVIIVGAATNNDPTTVVGVVLIVVGGIGGIVAAAYLQVAFSLATPVVMLEKLRVIAALKRSRALVRGDWWRVLGITMVVGLIAVAITAAISLPLDLAGGIGNVFSNDPAKQASLRALTFSGIGAFVGGTLCQPFAASAVALIYVDRRMRAEGLHVTLQQVTAPISSDPAAPTA